MNAWKVARSSRVHQSLARPRRSGQKTLRVALPRDATVEEGPTLMLSHVLMRPPPHASCETSFSSKNQGIQLGQGEKRRRHHPHICIGAAPRRAVHAALSSTVL
jgi:hypothetical protein